MVFVPLVFLGGITAVFFRALAFTMATALLASLLLAIFFTPVLAGLFLCGVKEVKGADLKEAEQAGRRRLRPILMTALATIFGMLPLALDIGSGAEMLQPLAIAVIGGVGISMILSLLITPVLFYLLRQKGL